MEGKDGREKSYDLFEEDEIKLDYKNILNLSSDETSAEIDDISNDVRHQEALGGVGGGGKKFELSSQDFTKTWDTMETSFGEKERAELAETFENEKSDIVKGFILEKRVLNREHEKEKQDLVSDFVKERQRMLDSFQQQVTDIEHKMSSSSSKPLRYHSSKDGLKSENFFNLTSEAKHQTTENNKPSPTPGKLLIRLDGDRILTPEQFISAMEMEERFESEREIIGKSFRKEKHKLKDKMDVEFSKKLLREKEKHEREISTLHAEIGKLRNLKNEVSDMWKTQATQLESEFFKERKAQERHNSDEKDNLRRRLEERNQSKLNAQQEEYDRMIRDLRNELRQIKMEVTKNEGDRATHKPNAELRKEIEMQFQSHYENETRLLRQQNEKLNTDIQNLTTEKYDLSRKLREVEHDKTSESKHLKQHTEKLNREYVERLKKATSQNEKLKSQLSAGEKQREHFKSLIKNHETANRNIEGKLESSERTITQYEDTVTSSRRENSNLSHEINLLRIEKEELSQTISQHSEQERSIKIDAQRIQTDANESKKKYVLLERDKLKLEKVVDGIRKETEKLENENKKSVVKIEAYAKEAERLRTLLEGERKENKRLHERFKTDAELLRKKETETSTVRTQLDNIKTQFETLKTRIEADNTKFCKMHTDKQNLQKQLDKIKQSGNIQNKSELLKIQNNYCKEFTKRLEYVKANYEREIFNLKEKIGELVDHGNHGNHGNHHFQHSKHQTLQGLQHCGSCTEHSNSITSNNNTKFIHENQALFESNLPTPLNVYNVHNNNDERHGLDHPNTKLYERKDIFIGQQEHDGGSVSQLPSRPKIADHRVLSEQAIRERLLKISKQEESDNVNRPDKEHSSTSIATQSMQHLFSRVQQAEVTSDNDELRNLLKDVRKEVLMLNKLIDEQTPETTPQITPRLTPPTREEKGDHQNSNNLLEQMKEFDQKTLELQDQLADKESEVDESKETMKRLYFENTELQRRLNEQEKELVDQESSCDELYKRRLMLEKLVDRLQNKLRDETSKRRKLEQASNAIMEDSREEDLESTV